MINDLKTFLTGYDCRNLIRFIGAYYEEGKYVFKIPSYFLIFYYFSYKRLHKDCLRIYGLRFTSQRDEIDLSEQQLAFNYRKISSNRFKRGSFLKIYNNRC
jgi:hypothetical protein